MKGWPSGYFGQVLEGSQAAIEATFERIQQDLPLGEVTLLEFAPAEARIFDSWAMAYVGEPSDLFAGLAGRTGFDESKILGERLLARLRDRVASPLPA
ncbi:BLUF domain-containing protein [Rhizobium sp. XQZ8]|uniref:BLUF domain-containing protein n=1 Tax=Rhizobium populisoli TaxID=2859785 RepID=UPI001C67B345|nr:BLUF domain-containing protein [Rhizobium populisoli]MBW6425422.1 BLUF domain-containing protein [Rhizobium populisoli]